MTTALYRLSSNEVLKISLRGQAFSERNTAIFGVLTDPAVPNGTEIREEINGVFGSVRILGFSKIAVSGTNTVRNATAGEIATFAAAETADENTLDADAVARWIDTHPRYRKIFKALLKRIIAENNQAAVQWNLLRVQIGAATNLSNLQSRVAANTADLPQRTLAQAVTALFGDISSGD